MEWSPVFKYIPQFSIIKTTLAYRDLVDIERGWLRLGTEYGELRYVSSCNYRVIRLYRITCATKTKAHGLDMEQFKSGLTSDNMAHWNEMADFQVTVQHFRFGSCPIDAKF